MIHLLFGYALSVVGNSQLNTIVFADRAYLHNALLAHSLHAISCKIQKQLLDLFGIKHEQGQPGVIIN
ncbi:hypothetical protein D3C79_973440 [compost metagenome]